MLSVRRKLEKSEREREARWNVHDVRGDEAVAGLLQGSGGVFHHKLLLTEKESYSLTFLLFVLYWSD